MTPIPELAHADQQTLLVALRDRIAPLIDDPTIHPRDLNSLCFRMLEIMRDLDALETPRPGRNHHARRHWPRCR